MPGPRVRHVQGRKSDIRGWRDSLTPGARDMQRQPQQTRCLLPLPPPGTKYAARARETRKGTESTMCQHSCVDFSDTISQRSADKLGDCHEKRTESKEKHL